jgi:hypothetical protein
MKTNHKLTLAVLAGAVIGVAGATAIHAQQVKVTPGYVIAEVEVTDPTTLKNMERRGLRSWRISMGTTLFVVEKRKPLRVNPLGAMW